MSRLVTESIQRLHPYVAGKPLEELAREYGVFDAVKLASNENPLGPSPRAVEAVIAHASSVHRYPDPHAFELRTQLAARLGVTDDELVFGNGSNELIELVLRTFTTPADHVVYAHPSFVVYPMACSTQGVSHTAVALDADYRHDLDAMSAAVDERTKVVFIANPNNPTGTHVGTGALSRFLSDLPERVIAVLDEAYFEYATAEDYPDGLQLRHLHERLVVLRTFSKAYALAGLRVGYAITTPQLASYLERVRAPFNVSSLGQAAAIAALADVEHLARGRELNERERRRVTEALRAAGLTVIASQANFVMILFQTEAAPVFERLLRRGVITRGIGPLPRALRVSIGTPEENSRMLNTLAEVMG